MFKYAIKILKVFYRRVLLSIAFYPVLISLGFFLLALIVLELESWELAETLKERVPYLFLIVLGANNIETHSVGFPTMLAAISGVFCIGLFVYFIHSISTSIQIQNIIDNIFRSSSRSLDKDYEDSSNLKVGLQEFRMDDFETIYSHKSGYYKGFDNSLLSDSL